MIFQYVKEADMDTNQILTLIEECKELIKLKGSKGSGGWGHSGRLGKHGGSKAGSGGLGKIGAKPSSSVSDRRSLAGKKKQPGLSKKTPGKKTKPAPKKASGGLTPALAKMNQQDFNAHLMSQIQSGKLNMQDAQKLSKLHAEQVPKKKDTPKKKPMANAQEVREKLAELDIVDTTKEKAIRKRKDRANKKQRVIRDKVNQAQRDVESGKISKQENEFITMRAQMDLNKTSRTISRINEDARRIQDETRIKKQRELLYTPEGPADIKAKLGSGFSSQRKKEMQEGIDEFAKLIGKGTSMDGMTVGVHDVGKGRSHATRGNIHVGKYSGKDIVVHEMGHVFEGHSRIVDMDATKNVYTQATSFLDRRTKGEKAQKLSDITGNKNYNSRETAKPDNFDSPYTGKIYKRGDTEIISMGLEQMFNNPAKFARDDPDYFDFTFNALENARR